MNPLYKLKVNDSWTFEMGPDDLQAYDVARLGEQSFHVLKGTEPFKVDVVHSDFNQKRYQLRVNGKLYEVLLSDGLDQLIGQMGFELGSSSAVAHIEAPMPGLILDIQVSVGQEVSEGDALLVLEAMKMENVILSPRDGVIKSIAVAEGAAVDKKDLLVEFE
jgi:acetyl/propionyl-CoA carboxylase alpha subunit